LEARHRARAARRVLVDQYWDDRSRLFRPRPLPRPRYARLRARAGLPWHYWWQAQALEALLDGVADGDDVAPTIAEDLLAGVAARSGGALTENDYFDDLAWMGLATWRAAEAGLAPIEVPLALAAAVLQGFDAQYGGFRWRRGGTYRNVATSAPGATLLARSAEAAGEESWLEVARQTAGWLHTRLVDPDGQVHDGCTRTGDVETVNPALWSYSAGAVAGLDLELARHTGAAEAAGLLARAARVVRRTSVVLRTIPPTDGRVWRDEAGTDTDADPALFRGILARVCADLVSTDPLRTRDIAEDMGTQARAAWSARDRHGRVGAGWVAAVPGPPSLAAHLSGTLTLAAATRLSHS
jgi:predicted alpha-1,6-mannanase (GH76 family)